MWEACDAPGLLPEPCFVKGGVTRTREDFGELVKIGWSEVLDCSSHFILFAS